MTTVAPEIFKAYDIRGIVDRTLTVEAAELIGKALGTTAKKKGVTKFVVGRDGRPASDRVGGHRGVECEERGAIEMLAHCWCGDRRRSERARAERACRLGGSHVAGARRTRTERHVQASGGGGGAP